MPQHEQRVALDKDADTPTDESPESTVRVRLLSPSPEHRFLALGYAVDASGTDVRESDVDELANLAAGSGLRLSVDRETE